MNAVRFGGIEWGIEVIARIGTWQLQFLEVKMLSTAQMIETTLFSGSED